MRPAVPAAVLAAVLTTATAGAGEVGQSVLMGARVGPAVLPAVIDVDLSRVPESARWQPGDPVILMEDRDAGEPAAERVPEPGSGLDPLLSRQAEAPAGIDPTFGTPVRGFAGLRFSGASPGDPVGDVGRTHFIQAVNGYAGQVLGARFAIYTKSGAMVAGPIRLGSLATGGACAIGRGDPIVRYDRAADRWLLMEISSANSLCVYISRTSDPVAGGWFRYEFSTPSLPDYPKLAVWPDAYYVSTNEPSPAAYALQRARMLAGLSAGTQRFSVPALPVFRADAMTPADVDGALPPPSGAPGIFMRHRDDEVHDPPGTPADFLELWEFRVDWTTPSNSTFAGPSRVAVSDFDVHLCGFAVPPSCVPQPSGTNALTPMYFFIMYRLQYRNFGGHQSLVGNFVTDATGGDLAAVRWFELRSPTNPPSVWTLWQDGTYGGDDTHRWLGSAALDGWGNLALAYSASSPTVFPSLRYAGRLAGSALGTLPEGEHPLVAGTISSRVSAWGDYASMDVDPVDDCTFWFTSQYSPAPDWDSWIAAFRFEYCGVPDFRVSANPAYVVEQPQTVRTATVTVSGLNGFASPVALSTPGLPVGITASIGVSPLTPAGSHAAASSPVTLTIAKTVAPGLYTITVRGTSGGVVHDAVISLRVVQGALFDTALEVPACATLGNSCDSGSLLIGRGPVGPEPNAPNTIRDSCADGTAGTFHEDESLDRLVVFSADGGNLRQGRTARIEATVWAYSAANWLDLYSAANAASPAWTHIATIASPGSGRQVLSATYTLPAGGRQAVRGRFRYSGSATSCASAPYNDHDDIAFPVAALP